MSIGLCETLDETSVPVGGTFGEIFADYIAVFERFPCEKRINGKPQFTSIPIENEI